MNNKELTAALETATKKIADLEKQLAEAKTAAPEKSKSKVQAEKALALLQAGTVTLEQLKEINPKYPSDPIYFVRNILKQTVVTHKVEGGKTFYTLPPAAPTTEAPAEQPAPAPEAAPAAA